MKIRIFILVILALLLARDIKAAPVTFEFSGTVAHVDDPVGVFDSSIVVGSPFYGSYTFNSDATDLNPDPEYGEFVYYQPAPDGLSMTVTVADSVFESIPASTISITNEAEGDSYYMIVPVDATGFESFTMTLSIGGDAEWLDSDKLPLVPPSLEKALSKGFYISNEEDHWGGVRGLYIWTIIYSYARSRTIHAFAAWIGRLGDAPYVSLSIAQAISAVRQLKMRNCGLLFDLLMLKNNQ